MFWVISVYINVRNILLKCGTFPPGHPLYNCACVGAEFVSRFTTHGMKGKKEFKGVLPAYRSTEFFASIVSAFLLKHTTSLDNKY